MIWSVFCQYESCFFASSCTFLSLLLLLSTTGVKCKLWTGHLAIFLLFHAHNDLAHAQDQLWAKNSSKSYNSDSNNNSKWLLWLWPNRRCLIELTNQVRLANNVVSGFCMWNISSLSLILSLSISCWCIYGQMFCRNSFSLRWLYFIGWVWSYIAFCTYLLVIWTN